MAKGTDLQTDSSSKKLPGGVNTAKPMHDDPPADVAGPNPSRVVAGRSAVLADIEYPSDPVRPSRVRTIGTAGVRIATGLLSAALLVGVWQLVSAQVGSEVVPTPWATAQAIKESLGDGVLWSDMAVTGKRIVGAFTVALVLSIVSGCLLGLSKWASRLFGSWVTVAGSVPSLLYIVVCYLWIGLNDRAAILGCALIVTPAMTFAIWDGVKALNPDLGEMARAFDTPQSVIVRRIVVPQTLPFIFTAARSGLSLTWRIMIFAELVGRSSGVGYRIQYWYNLFDMERVLATALPFVIVMLVVEFAVLRPLERRLFRWRRSETR